MSAARLGRGALLRKLLCTCRVNQFLCCSLRFGVLLLALVLLVNASLMFAGEAVLYFDLGAAVVAQLEGQYLPPGTKLSSGQHVHGALITTGLYSLLASLVGFYAALRDSLRWTTVFFLTQVINTMFALAILLVTAVAGQVTAPTLGAELPMICANVYFTVVVNSYRLTLRERVHGVGGPASAVAGGSSSSSAAGGLAVASGGSIDVGSLSVGSDGGAAAVPSASTGGAGGALTGSKIAPYRDAAGGRRGVQLGDGFDDDDDDLALTVQDVQLSVGAARPSAAAGGAAAAAGGRARPGAAAAVALSLDDGLDEDDNDLGRGGTVGRRV